MCYIHATSWISERGSYLTAIREQTVRYAERFTRRGREAFINEYELDEETPDFNVSSMKTIRK